jgi:MFS family permease
MTAPELRRARIAVLGCFFVLGAATATWAARLPAIKASLHLSDGGLGLALFAVPAGSVLTLALSGRIVDAFGAARVMRIAGLLVAAALVAIGLGPATGDLLVLIAALVWYGATAGLLDVSMNTCGARLETGYGRPIMSSLQAGYSIAGLAGAGIGGIFPQLVSSAARLDPARAGRNIARIAAVAYLGLLCGPVAIGAAASGVGLRDALLIPAALAVLVAVAAGVMRPRHDRGGGAAPTSPQGREQTAARATPRP